MAAYTDCLRRVYEEKRKFSSIPTCTIGAGSIHAALMTAVLGNLSLVMWYMLSIHCQDEHPSTHSRRELSVYPQKAVWMVVVFENDGVQGDPQYQYPERSRLVMALEHHVPTLMRLLPRGIGWIQDCSGRSRCAVDHNVTDAEAFIESARFNGEMAERSKALA